MPAAPRAADMAARASGRDEDHEHPDDLRTGGHGAATRASRFPVARRRPCSSVIPKRGARDSACRRVHVDLLGHTRDCTKPVDSHNMLCYDRTGLEEGDAVGAASNRSTESGRSFQRKGDLCRDPADLSEGGMPQTTASCPQEQLRGIIKVQFDMSSGLRRQRDHYA